MNISAYIFSTNLHTSKECVGGMSGNFHHSKSVIKHRRYYYMARA
ncbi:MAG TPA: hypothetical protein VEV16_11815 [Daejeonella sp.]|nr:hypothetical protein [Daejeonella sp.]